MNFHSDLQRPFLKTHPTVVFILCCSFKILTERTDQSSLMKSSPWEIKRITAKMCVNVI